MPNGPPRTRGSAFAGGRSPPDAAGGEAHTLRSRPAGGLARGVGQSKCALGRGSDGVPTEVHHVQLLRDPDRLRHGRRGEPANAGADLMYGSLKERLSTELQADRGRGADQARAGHHLAAGGPRSMPPSAARVLNFCANNYLGLANHPALIAAAEGGARRATATAWPRSASSAAPRTCTRQLEARISALPRHRRHDPLLLLLRRQRRPVRDAARRGGRDHLRRAQPRLDHRRHPALQGASASATPTTTWPTWRRS